jgi:E3 ubiquitin-protein ligase ATL4
MASTAVQLPPSSPAMLPERRVPVLPRMADDRGGGESGDARGSDSGSLAGISPSILIIAIIVVVMLLA